MHPASREQALTAVRAFHAEHGRLPRWREWERATESRPCAKTIERPAGRELLAEAMGVRPNEVEVSWVAVLDDRVEAMLVALRAARDELGWWPTAAEWDRSGRRPSSRTLVRHFGGWRAACWAVEQGVGRLRASRKSAGRRHGSFPVGGARDGRPSDEAAPWALCPVLHRSWAIDVERIDRARIVMGWTRGQLDEATQVAPKTLNDMRSGRRRLRLDTVQTVARVVGLTLPK